MGWVKQKGLKTLLNMGFQRSQEDSEQVDLEHDLSKGCNSPPPRHCYSIVPAQHSYSTEITSLQLLWSSAAWILLA